MANATLAKLGVRNGVSDGSYEQENGNFLEVFSGEVLTAFDTKNIFRELHRMRTIEHGKGASFPVLGRATGRYHVPGTPVLGSNNPKIGNRTINVDDLLLSDIFIDDLEDAKLHFDVRQEYSRQLGVSLANAFDEKLARIGVLAARSAGSTSDHFGGSMVKNTAAATDAKVLVGLIFNAAEFMDEKDVPEEDRHVVLKPTQYHMLVRDKEPLNRDWNGEGSYAHAKLPFVADMTVHKSNNMPNGKNITAPIEGERNSYIGDFTDTVALCFNRQAIGTVKLFDLMTELSGPDFHVMYQGDLIVAKYAMGHGILRPDCAVEVSKAA